MIKYFSFPEERFFVNNVFMSEFLIKYLLRVTHIGSIIAICHKAITDFQMNDISSAHSGMYAILGIAAIVSGIIWMNF
jgi:hypothetical protein